MREKSSGIETGRYPASKGLFFGRSSSHEGGGGAAETGRRGNAYMMSTSQSSACSPRHVVHCFRVPAPCALPALERPRFRAEGKAAFDHRSLSDGSHLDRVHHVTVWSWLRCAVHIERIRFGRGATPSTMRRHTIRAPSTASHRCWAAPAIAKLLWVPPRSFYHLYPFAILTLFYRRNFHHHYNLWGATSTMCKPI